MFERRKQPLSCTWILQHQCSFGFVFLYCYIVELRISNQDSLLILLKVNLQIVSNLDEITTNSGGNWEQATLVSHSWCPLTEIKMFHELMKSSDHVRGERSNKMSVREADSDAPEQFILSFSQSPLICEWEVDQRLCGFFWRLRPSLLLVGVSASERKGFISTSIFGSAH